MIPWGLENAWDVLNDPIATSTLNGKQGVQFHNPSVVFARFNMINNNVVRLLEGDYQKYPAKQKQH